MSGSMIGEVSMADELAYFVEELRKRRDRVYDLLDNWPGAPEFKPRDIHDGLFSYVRHRGKGLRPALLMLCAGAVGGDEEQALSAAGAVEIFHIWTLVHDDIIDRDDIRRGNETVHAQYARTGAVDYDLKEHEARHYGSTVAILSGDLQQSWSYALLCDSLRRGVNAETVLRLIERMATSLTPRLLEGEMLDVQYSLTAPEQLTHDQILNMLSGKSAALLEYSAWAGATIGLGGRPDTEQYAERLGRFALLSGLAFQLQDDILGLTADEAKLGKPVGSDIREGKRTLILHNALQLSGDSERAELMEIVGKSSATQEEIGRALDIIRNSGALQDVGQLADSLITQALNILDTMPESDSKRLLRTWCTFMLARTY